MSEGLTAEMEEAVLAAVELIGRTGATDFTYGYLHDDVPVVDADWWAKAHYQGALIMVEHQLGPVEAIEGLVVEVMTGAQCQRCGGLVELREGGAVAYPDAILANGIRWSQEDIEAAGFCRWKREGRRWEAGCTLPPEGDDELHTTEKLARALEALNDNRLTPMVWRARRGYYHDFLSPEAAPEYQLMHELREFGLEEFAQRVADDEFTASKAESAAWARSDEGKESLAGLLPGRHHAPPAPPAPDDKPAGEAFWRAQRGT